MDSKKACILTIDIGTSAARIIGFDYSGNEVVYKKGTYPTFHPHPDWSEQDPEQVYITILFLLKGILNDVAFRNKFSVETIVFSSNMHSVLALDKNGNTLGNAIIWSDNRAGDIANELKSSALGDELYQNTGTPIHAMSPLAKIQWIRLNEREKFEKTKRFVSLKEFVIYQLTGEFYIDYSLASATGFFNLQNKEWDKGALAYAQIDASYFSKPASIFCSKLKIKEPILDSLKLGRNVKLIIGSSDGCLATLCSGAFRTNKAVVSLTSSGAVRVLGKELLRDGKGSFFNYIFDDEHYISGGPTNNGGIAFEWVARGLGMVGEKPFEDVLIKLQNDAAKVKEGAEGLIFLPYIQGERAPIWNSNARGSFFGLNITHEPQHLVRATIEGVLYEIYAIGKSIKEHHDFSALRLNGYYATHPLWSRIICDIFGLPVTVSSYKNSANLGAAMVGLTSIGIFNSLEEALEIMPKSIELYPSEEKNKTYAKYFALFEKLTFKLKDEFDEIAKLQNDYK